MIGIAARRGGSNVSTTYLATMAATLAAGYTCKSLRKYEATHDTLLTLRAIFDAAIAASLTSVDVMLYQASATTAISPDELLTDLTELAINYQPAFTHVY